MPVSVDYETAADAPATAPTGARGARAPAVRRLLAELRVPLIGFVSSRFALLLVGLLTEVFIVPIVRHVELQHFDAHALLNIWGQWDSGWYVGLATDGYMRTRGALGQANWAFFPAYPALASALAGVTQLSVFQAMLVVSNVSFVAALVLMRRLAREEFDERTADLTVLLICAAPGSYIFSAAYTESLFLAGIAGALLLLRRRSWIAAGAVAAAAALTRNLGIGLLLPFGWAAGERLLALRRVRDRAPATDGRSEIARMLIGAMLPLVALAGLGVFMLHRTGDPLAFVHAQSAWGRKIGSPLKTVLASVRRPGSIPDGDLVSFAVCWLSLALLAVLALMRRWRLLSLALFMVIVPLATGLASYARYALVIAPLWLAAARLLSSRPTTAVATIIVLATVNGFLMVAWTLGLWVTT